MLALGPASRSRPASSPFPCSRCFSSRGYAASSSSSSCQELEGLGGGKARRQERRGGKSCSELVPGRTVEDEGCTRISTSTVSTSRARGDSLPLGPRSWG
ncbi:hypothetical protein NN561_014023 [Cricetulus griseus]